MDVQTITFIQVSEKAEQVIDLGRKHHWRFRIVPDLQGTIAAPVYNSKGDWVYMPLGELDKRIIPKAAFRRHQALERSGFQVAQVIIGHEVKIAPEVPLKAPQRPFSTGSIDWSNAAAVAGKGLLVGMMGLAMVSLYALTGALSLVDPSYCVVLAGDETESVIELMRWNTDVRYGTST